MPDIDSLKSLVFASPEYYQAYLTVKHELLSHLVEQLYDGVLDISEALTALRSENLDYSCEREMTIAFLDRWRRRDEIRASGKSSSSQIDEPQNPEEIIKLFNLHKVLSFFVEDFSINAPKPPLIEPLHWAKLMPLQLTPFGKAALPTSGFSISNFTESFSEWYQNIGTASQTGSRFQTLAAEWGG
ncbi:hypothetical protein N7488_001105 [Penicillium malachiteum]|nr:hypothetical protein N7488_001105 [Penicillium malachiteum]